MRPTAIDDAGFIADAHFLASPNCDERPPGELITLAVIHAISLPPGQFGGDGVAQLFTNSLEAASHPYYATICDLRVSAHAFVRRDGSLIQFVPCGMRAWHAGVSAWRGRSGCNDFSIGIELEGSDHLPFADAQYERLAGLLQRLMSRYPIIDVVGHDEIAPGRKTDPGPYFDWPRLRARLAQQ